MEATVLTGLAAGVDEATGAEAADADGETTADVLGRQADLEADGVAKTGADVLDRQADLETEGVAIGAMLVDGVT